MFYSTEQIMEDNKMKKSIFFLSFLAMFIVSISIAYSNNITIEIEGLKLDCDVPAQIVNGRTVVPLRNIFEALGAQVMWDGSTQKITAQKENIEIELHIGNNKSSVNGKEIMLDVPAMILNGRTMVPTRFIAESLGMEVTWVGNTSTVSVIDRHKKAVSNNDKNEKIKYSISHSKDSFLDLEIIDDILMLNSKASSKYKWAWIRIEDTISDKRLKERFVEIGKDGRYSFTSNLSGFNNGVYKIEVYYGVDRFSKFTSFYWKNIFFEVQDNQYLFICSPVYSHNKEISENNNNMLDSDLEIGWLYGEDLNILQSLVDSITKDISDDYMKTKEISEWVSNNIYYDWDSYLDRKCHIESEREILNQKRTVCQGYANLSQALLRLSGIPTRVVSGYALGESANGAGWDEVEHSSSNHGWIEAYVNDRWIIIDPAWNSNNKYENGKFIKKDSTNGYFDTTMEAFSHTHKIISYKR